MSALVVDTSSWISYFAGRESSAIDEALSEGRVYLPPIVAAELCSGDMKQSQRRELMALLTDLPLCAADLAHWCRVGDLRNRLRRRGFSISTPDAHIAQCAIDISGILLTEDKVFGKIAGAAVLLLHRDSSFR